MFAAFLIVTLGKERGVIGAQPFKGVVHYSGRKGGLLGLNHVRVWSIIVAGEQSSQSPVSVVRHSQSPFSWDGDAAHIECRSSLFS